MTKAIRRVKKLGKDNKKDFYQTHKTMVIALKEWLIENMFPESMSYLDPCCGKGIIYKTLQDTFYRATYFDRFLLRVKRNFLLHSKKYGAIIMNPPYSEKYKFIDKARSLSNYVFCLLPLDISNYNMFFRDYENISEFIGKIQMSPKMFLNETDKFTPGGTSQYGWYIWSKNNNTKSSITWYKDLRVIRDRLETKEIIESESI